MTQPLEWLAKEPPNARNILSDAFDKAERAEFAYHWHMFARDEQLPPPGDWRIWLILAGRGFEVERIEH